VRTTYGASATMAAQYLLATGDDDALTRPLATALLYGIITDTRSLSRSASNDDLQMFAYLFPRADHAALRNIQHPSYAPVVLRRFGRTLERVRVRGGLAYAHLGRLPAEQEHVVAQLAEFCLGMADARVSAVSGVFGDRLILSARAIRESARLGERLRAAFDEYGSAGGHPVMAKAVVRLADWRRAHATGGRRGLERSVMAALRRVGL
jgi:nanoRNase/pAp phosphatase (c-di-AMP/oligoRNAs hydrolase)